MTAAVDVLMPVWNGARFLEAAIDSLRGQTLSDWQLIVVDDGSVDATAAILSRLAARDRRIRVLRQERRGIVAALNRGIAETSAAFIARLDADDVALPGRLERQLQLMRARPEIGLLGSYALTIDERNRSLGIRRPTVGPALAAALVRGNPFVHSSVMLRREPLLRVGGYRTAFEGAEDYDLWLRLAELGVVDILPEVLVQYRVHRPPSGEGAVLTAFRARLARRAAEERRAGRADPSEGFSQPLQWNAIPPTSIFAVDARDFGILAFANPAFAEAAELGAVEPATLYGIAERLDHGERRLAQQGLINIIRRHDRPRSLGTLRLLALLFWLHPPRAMRLIIG